METATCYYLNLSDTECRKKSHSSIIRVRKPRMRSNRYENGPGGNTSDKNPDIFKALHKLYEDNVKSISSISRSLQVNHHSCLNLFFKFCESGKIILNCLLYEFLLSNCDRRDLQDERVKFKIYSTFRIYSHELSVLQCHMRVST